MHTRHQVRRGNSQTLVCLVLAASAVGLASWYLSTRSAQPVPTPDRNADLAHSGATDLCRPSTAAGAPWRPSTVAGVPSQPASSELACARPWQADEMVQRLPPVYTQVVHPEAVGFSRSGSPAGRQKRPGRADSTACVEPATYSAEDIAAPPETSMRLRIGGTADRHPGPTIPPATQVTWPPLLAQQSPWNPINQLRNALTPQPSAEGGRTAKIPLASSLAPGSVEVAVEQGLVSIVARNAPLDEILGILAQRQRLNLIAGENVTARISITLESVPLDEALTHVCAVAGYTWTRQGNVLLVTSVSASDQTAPAAQGREVRVFTLDYVAAADVDTVIRGLLSPVGQSFPNEMEQSNKLKTQEAVVVEDLPAYLDRIGRYVQQIDIPPRQVLIEAHVMKIELEDEALHGVNLTYLDTVIPKVTIETSGFAKASDPQAFFFSLTASSLRALLEALETTTDAKTLASPKVFAVNGQEARIQIGEQLGYRVTTTTQTSSLESVDFLDVGVVLTVTPQISRDGQVLMHVKPEVSSGKIDQVTELPEEETTEVQTTVLLPDGHGIVIGGLIQEKDLETQIKVPIVGDLWLIGRLFQKREVSRKRSEIVIAVIPHVVPYSPAIQQRECDQFHQASTPLLHGPLRSTPRPFEPRFPDAGQRLPLISKTNRFCPPPDPGSWAPQVSPGACLPGAQPVEGEYYGPVPIHPGEMLLGPGQQPAIDHSGPQEQMELLPAPLPAALPATGG